MTTLYTFGYLTPRAERIIAELIATQTPLVDLRYEPTARNYRFAQDYMMKRKGIVYFHIKAFGNELYLAAEGEDHSIRLHDAPAGMKQLESILERYHRAAIFCACPKWQNCHRSTVAQLAWEQLDVQVVHL